MFLLTRQEWTDKRIRTGAIIFSACFNNMVPGMYIVKFRDVREVGPKSLFQSDKTR